MALSNWQIDFSSLYWPISCDLRGRVQGYQCGVVGFVQMRGLSKCGVIQISQNMLMRGGSLNSNPSLNPNPS